MAPAEAQKPADAFQLWRPGVLDALRGFLLSERFQSAVQLTAGVLFVSLFVFVDALRFPGSCVAILLYFVVAVTAAPDCHIGTRIFLCGFMIGPMWLSLLLGGIIATLGKLAPTQQGQLIILCVLGPLALIPFAINRVGTSHLYLFAMGMVSCLYLGMPILAGWAAPNIATLWARAVGYVLVAALIGMFAGSVLSIIVLPSLASHKLEEEVSTALRLMGVHLSTCASLLWRPGKTDPQALPRHLEGLHPLLLQSTHALQPGMVAPGLLDRDLGAAPVSPRQVYVAAMDWFEHLSRPPSDGAASPRPACFRSCRSATTSESGRSERVKSTFYGPSASIMAAAVVAAAQDSEEGQQWQQQLQLQEQAQEEGYGHPSSLRSQSWAIGGINGSRPPARRQHSTPAHRVSVPGRILEDPTQLRLGSTVTAASVQAAKSDLLQLQPSHGSNAPADGRPVLVSSLQRGYSGPGVGGAGPAAGQPCPSIAAVRQLLAHANQLLEAAGAEPQWLRHGERRFLAAPWTKLVGAAQVVALRLTALDLIKRDFVSLWEEPHSFQVADDLSQLLKRLYGEAAAALALLSEQIRCKEQLTDVCTANQRILRRPEWQAARQELLQQLEGTLATYFVQLQQASPETPVTLPSAHWVRRWMFFHTTTLSLLDALDGLAAAAEAALPTQLPQAGRRHWWQCWPSQRQQQQQNHKQKPQQAHADSSTADPDLEAGAGPAAGTRVPTSPAGAAMVRRQHSEQHQQQPQQQPSINGTVGLVKQPTPAVLDTLTSMQHRSSGGELSSIGAVGSSPAVDAAAAADENSDVRTQQQGALPAAATPAAEKNRSQAAAAAAAVPGGAGGWCGRLHRSLLKHTGWIRPWLPLALNMKQYENLKMIATQELPAAFSNRKAFLAALRNRRVQAAVKYWCVLVVLLVGTLCLEFFVPVVARLNPTFGYTLAAVGMSDRVESTVQKVFLWTGATLLGAVLGWAMMWHAAMALNSVALGAVMCAVAFCVGTLERGPSNSSSLFTLFTLTTLASIVLCQCCGHLGSTWVSVTRAASVIVAAVVALGVQNLVLPWSTSTWALEQLGVVYKEATEVLADLICQLYEETGQLLERQQQQQQQAAADTSGNSSSGGGKEPAGAAAATAGAAGAADSSSGGGGGAGRRPPLHRLQLLDEAVRRVWLKECQQQEAADAAAATAAAAAAAGGASSQQQGRASQQQPEQQQGLSQHAQRGSSFTSTVAAGRLSSLGRMFTSSSQLDQLLQPHRAPHSSSGGSSRLWPASLAPAKSVAAASSAGGAATDPADAAAAAAALEAAIAEDGARKGEEVVCEMVQLLQQRRQKHQQGQQQGRVGVTGLQLQGRLVRPLVQVKISLVLDTTAWRSGPLATPPLVLHMLQAIFDLVDALAALQQAVSMPVQELSGSWDWTLMHIAGAWAALLMQAMQLADATAAHVLDPTADSAQQLLDQVQAVQHKRFEYFAVQRELRRLLHTALATDSELVQAHVAGVNEWQLQGHLRYSACVYATGKVLDHITAAARCALNEYK